MAAMQEVEAKVHLGEPQEPVRIELRVPPLGIRWDITLERQGDPGAVDRQVNVLATMLENAAGLVGKLVAHADQEAARVAPLREALEPLPGKVDWTS